MTSSNQPVKRLILLAVLASIGIAGCGDSGDAENGETDTSLDVARDCGYISDDEHAEMAAECKEVGRMLVP